MYHYLFAHRGYRLLCIRYTESKGVALVDYLVDRAWSLSPAQQVHYDMRVDENLSPVEIKTVDDTTKKIEI